MKNFESSSLCRTWSMALLLSAVALVTVGCGGGGRDEILGTGGATAVVVPPVAPPGGPIIVPPPAPVAPTVATNLPATDAINVPVTTNVTATFSKNMDPASINAANLSVTCAAPCVSPTVSPTYNVATRTATFNPDTPTGVLLANTRYTATVSNAAKDTAGLALASNFVWAFTTAVDTTPPTVTAVNPDAAGVPPSTACLTKVVNATFSKPMNQSTISTASFTVQPSGTPLGAALGGTVTYDVSNKVASFTATTPLLTGNYTATITTTAKDLAGNALAANRIWTFDASGAPCALPPLVNLFGQAATYAIAATAGVTNASPTTINGNVVLDPSATCNSVSVLAAGTFGLCGGFAPTLNGVVASPLFPDAGVTSGKVKADLRAAYIALSPAILVGGTSIPAGTTLGNSAGTAFVQGDNYFKPGVYQSLTSISITGDVTLDAQGDPNATFVFQSSSTIGTPGSGADRILLINGAKASNVFWWAGSAATIGTNSVWQGNVLASDNVTLRLGATSCGRLFAGASTAGAFVLDGNVVSVPGNASGPATCK